MSPEAILSLDLACLAEHTLKALGVNGDKPDTATILEHSIQQACLELEAVESLLERSQVQAGLNEEMSRLVYIVAGIRERLELACECGSMLANVMAGGSEHDLIVKASEAAE